MRDQGIFPDTDSWWPVVIATLVTVVITIKWFVAGKKCPSQQLMERKIVLITGTDTELGLQTAIELVSRGAQIILATESVSNGENVKNKILKLYRHAVIDVKIVNVGIQKRIHFFVNEIKREYNRIDVLINCQEIVFHPPINTQEGFEIICATNYLGPFLLTHLLLPLLVRSENGRIINLSSYAHTHVSLNEEDVTYLTCAKRFREENAFPQSKLALIMFTRHLATLLKNTSITVNAVNPGLVRDTKKLQHTHMMSSTFTKISILPWMWLFMKSPKQGSQTLVYLAVEPSLSRITGGYYSNCQLEILSKEVTNPTLAQDLYKRSCEMCKIDGEQLIEKLPNKQTIISQ